MENERKWRWADVGRWIVRAIGAIKRGDFMNNMKLRHGQPYSYDNSPLGQSYAQAPIEPGFTQPGQNMEQQTPDYVNPAAPSMPGTVPGKKGGSLIVPIILIILILAVILIDVFWLFKKQIWGDDSSSSTSAASYSTFLDEGQTY